MQEIMQFLQAHWALSSAMLVVLIILMILEFIKIKRGSQRLSPAQAVNLINHNNAVIVDVRNSDLFANGHIVDAISIPANELETKYKKLEKSRANPIIVVCAQGIEAQRASVSLQKLGFQTFVLANGLRAWTEAGLPLVKG